MKNSMTNKLMTALAGAVAVIAVALSPASAASAAIEYAKNECQIGEMSDGYLGIVRGSAAGGDPSDAVKAEMRDVNQQRKAVYVRLADQNGVSVEVAAQLTGKKLVEGAPSGQCVSASPGSWTKV
jgi:hypothetical protein